jgi:hypothetical protein
MPANGYIKLLETIAEQQRETNKQILEQATKLAAVETKIDSHAERLFGDEGALPRMFNWAKTEFKERDVQHEKLSEKVSSVEKKAVWFAGAGTGVGVGFGFFMKALAAKMGLHLP